MLSEYRTLTLTKKDQVATVAFLEKNLPGEGRPDGHAELAEVLVALRQDHDVRVVVMTGAGRNYKVPGGPEFYNASHAPDHNEPSRAWRNFTGIIRCHQTIAEMEKPVIARVNGDAAGFGQSMVFACDLIIAREDAIIMDHHMGGILNTFDDSGAPKVSGHEFSSVPGDGGLALLPMHMFPARAKEYLMLARQYTGRELADMGIINYAVPADQLDAKVNEIVQALLKRGAYALAWTKRVANRRLVEHLNMTLDAGVGYEIATFLQNEKLGGQQPLSL
jgi:enoyl-CoA hydratase/carnithine racemase